MSHQESGSSSVSTCVTQHYGEVLLSAATSISTTGENQSRSSHTPSPSTPIVSVSRVTTYNEREPLLRAVCRYI